MLDIDADISHAYVSDVKYVYIPQRSATYLSESIQTVRKQHGQLKWASFVELESEHFLWIGEWDPA